MSKVVHLSDDAHNRAKAFCKEHGLKMSDWVAALIEQAVARGGGATVSFTSPSTSVPASHGAVTGTPIVASVANLAAASSIDNSRAVRRGLVTKKKVEQPLNIEPQVSDEGLPVYAAPPFWAKASD